MQMRAGDFYVGGVGRKSTLSKMVTIYPDVIFRRAATVINTGDTKVSRFFLIGRLFLNLI